MESRSGWTMVAGFLFWFVMAVFLYTGRNDWGIILGLVALVAGLAWAGLAYLSRKRPEPEEPPPPSTLPDFDFKDTKPSDFE